MSDIGQSERAAFLSLARTERKLSHQYRRAAREDELRGDLRWYRHDIAEAARLWRDAKFHLRHARMRDAS